MKKANVITIIAIIACHFMCAQNQNENQHSNFKIGLNLGPNHNTLNGDSFADKYDSEFGYFVGLHLEFKIDARFSILTNVNYETKTVTSLYNTTVGSFQNFENVKIEDKLKFQYLNIPLLVRHYFGFDNEFFLNGGFFYNHLIDVSNKMINTETNENLSDLDFNELFKPSEYGISIGVGIDFALNEQSDLAIEIRDDFGMSDIGKTEFGNISQTKTNTIKLIVIWSFNL